jgi:hypothetical protein
MRSRIASMNADVAQAEAEYIRQQTLLGDRVTASYRQDDWYFLDLLLDSKGSATSSHARNSSAEC